MNRTTAPHRWLEAFRAIRALIRDPDDTAQVFRIIRAFSSSALDRQFERFRRLPQGQRILAREGTLLDRLADRAALERLPRGSLGRAYADFTRAESISPQGLVDASLEAPPVGVDASPERIRFAERLRDSHDLWHVVTGYGRDLVGEAALLAFTWRQTGNRGIALIVLAAWWKAGRDLPGGRAMIRDGIARAGRSEWLPAADWESLLAEPLDDVRRKLGITPAERYAAVRSAAAPHVA
ncbi:MAG: Coq4 family protein [Myxococcota bacterium]